jgi:GT2 family glycosyltransferase
MRPAVSVVVPTRDRPAMLERALAHVQDALGADDEVIIVDSFSQVPVAVPGARVIRAARPGASRARNIGWRAAAHSIVAFVDDDVVVSPEWASALAGALEARPEAAFVTGRIDRLNPADYPVAVKESSAAAPLTSATIGVLGHGASMAVRRSALVQVGGFDEELGGGARYPAAEELDLFDRLFASGWTGWYEPSAVAWHDQWRSKGQRLQLAWRYGVGMGARLAKLQRTDPQRAMRVARDVVWDTSVRSAAHHARAGYQTALAIDILNVGGCCSGWARATVASVGRSGPRARSDT